MNYKLVELNLDMARELEYEMFQDIPVKERGSTNLCKGLPLQAFKSFLKNEISKKYLTSTIYGSPVDIYIFYVDEKPVGLIGIRLNPDEYWYGISGHFYYVVRLSERGKGYGTKMLAEGLKILKDNGLKQVKGRCAITNIGSNQVMIRNGGKCVGQVDDSNIYMFDL